MKIRKVPNTPWIVSKDSASTTRLKVLPSDSVKTQKIMRRNPLYQGSRSRLKLTIDLCKGDKTIVTTDQQETLLYSNIKLSLVFDHQLAGLSIRQNKLYQLCSLLAACNLQYMGKFISTTDWFIKGSQFLWLNLQEELADNGQPSNMVCPITVQPAIKILHIHLYSSSFSNNLPLVRTIHPSLSAVSKWDSLIFKVNLNCSHLVNSLNNLQVTPQSNFMTIIDSLSIIHSNKVTLTPRANLLPKAQLISTTKSTTSNLCSSGWTLPTHSNHNKSHHLFTAATHSLC